MRREQQRGGERDDFPLKLQMSNNLVFPLAYMLEKSADWIPGVLGEAFSRRSRRKDTKKIKGETTILFSVWTEEVLARKISMGPKTKIF